MPRYVQNRFLLTTPHSRHSIRLWEGCINQSYMRHSSSLGFASHLSNVSRIIDMTDTVKKVKDASQDVEAKMKTSEDHAKGKPSSETLNKAKVKARDALT